ncbi:MAG: phytanoyl-CoA dioxygenase family protein [Planctomycetota bacterium]
MRRLDDPHAPAAEHVSRFHADGHATLRGLLDPEELRSLEPALSAAVEARNDLRGRPWSERTTYERAFVQVMNLWRDDDAARQIAWSPRLASTAAALLGVEGVRLYHDQALYKEPAGSRGGQTPWHVDQYYWPLASDRSITAWIPLVDVPAEMGPLAFATGSQRFEEGRDLAISDESEDVCGRALADAGFERTEEPFALGDVSFHLGWTFHCAPPNRSAAVRKVMTVIYVDAEMRVAEPTNANQRADLETWLPGLAPGDVAASPINPLLWPPAC